MSPAKDWIHRSLETFSHSENAGADIGNSLAFQIAVMQYFCMSTAIAISARGTLTLPIGLRRKLGLDRDHAVLLAEERPDGIFLHPAITVPIRDISAATIKRWVKADEDDAASVRIVKR
jgi:bifunctional DNA-binding transcriptional regulator/antitoxin component of YhaV-PrlF toxin-antitoxin module